MPRKKQKVGRVNDVRWLTAEITLQMFFGQEYLKDLKSF